MTWADPPMPSHPSCQRKQQLLTNPEVKINPWNNSKQVHIHVSGVSADFNPHLWADQPMTVTKENKDRLEGVIDDYEHDERIWTVDEKADAWVKYNLMEEVEDADADDFKQRYGEYIDDWPVVADLKLLEANANCLDFTTQEFAEDLSLTINKLDLLKKSVGIVSKSRLFWKKEAGRYRRRAEDMNAFARTFVAWFVKADALNRRYAFRNVAGGVPAFRKDKLAQEMIKMANQTDGKKEGLVSRHCSIDCIPGKACSETCPTMTVMITLDDDEEREKIQGMMDMELEVLTSEEKQRLFGKPKTPAATAEEATTAKK